MKAKDVRKVLESIYAHWHLCGLKKPERGLKKGRLCDVCLAEIESHMKNLKSLQ